MKSFFTCCFLATFLLIVPPVHGQASFPGTKAFSNKTIRFEIPSKWALIDRSNGSVQQFNLVPEQNDALIMVIAQDAKLADFASLSRARDLTEPQHLNKFLTGFSTNDRKALRSGACTNIGSFGVPGIRIDGISGGKPSRVEMFSFMLDKIFITAIYMRSDESAHRNDESWELVRNSLSRDDDDFQKFPLVLIDQDSKLVELGEALDIPRPSSPSVSSSGVRLTIRVEALVTVDQDGRNTSVQARGSKNYSPYVIDAAKRAKFEPTKICGKPSRVIRIIQYEFETR